MTTFNAYLGTGTLIHTGSNSTASLDNGPTPLPAAWLSNVDRRVRNSVIVAGETRPNEGQWLTQEIANTAMQFFQIASDMLPGEPFIYSSNGQDLIAEFKTPAGQLTGVISGSSLTVYAKPDGAALQEAHVNLLTATPAGIHAKLKPIASLISIK